MIEDDGNNVREKLSTMSFEELKNLKEKLGLKVYNEAIFGSSGSIGKVFKRENKNRPREISSRKPEPVRLPKLKVPTNRDPRFDGLCGEFNDVAFRKNYSFLDEVRKKEKAELITKLKTEKDPDERKNIKRVLQRFKNKEREQRKKEEKEKKKQKEVDEKIQALKDGKRPHFRTKLEKKVAGLVEQYKDLKGRGKLRKHIEKQNKRKRQQDRKMGVFDGV